MKFNWKKITIWFSSVLFALIGVLVLHIYLVTRPKTSDQPVRQLSRIDFKQQIDPTEIPKIKSFVAHLDGVTATYFNPASNVLVYNYVVGKQTSENVYNKLIAFGHYKADRYIVTAAMAKTGCPIIDNDSFTGKVSAYLTAIVK